MIDTSKATFRTFVIHVNAYAKISILHIFSMPFPRFTASIQCWFLRFGHGEFKWAMIKTCTAYWETAFPWLNGRLRANTTPGKFSADWTPPMVQTRTISTTTSFAVRCLLLRLVQTGRRFSPQTVRPIHFHAPVCVSSFFCQKKLDLCEQ